jgi:hypothetical protein
MPLNENDWQKIYDYVESQKPKQELNWGKVTRVDSGRLLVYCEKEFGDLAIKMAAHITRVFYDDDSPRDTIGYSLTVPPGNPYRERRREALGGNSQHRGAYGEYVGIIPEMPHVGDTVVVWLPYGVERDAYFFGITLGYTTF